jgi:hypothetical protein
MLESLFDDFEEPNFHNITKEYDVYLIDEYSMISYKKYFHIMHRIRKQYPESTIKIFGDINQCPATESLLYNIKCCQVLRSILGKKGCIISMKYNSNLKQRCDEDIIKTIDNLIKNGTIPDDILDIIKSNKMEKYDIFITYYREKTIKNNDAIRDPTKLKKGDVVICSANQQFIDEKGKKVWIYNNERLVLIDDMFMENEKCYFKVYKNGKIIKILNTWSDYNGRKRYLFTLERSETIYKYQGMTIIEPYIIQDASNHLYTKEMIITAIGRAQSINQIYIENIEKLYNYKFRSCYDESKIKEAKNKELQEYNYYLLRENEPKLYYVGHTKLSLNERWKDHVRYNNSSWTDKSYMTLIGKYVCHSRSDAERVEKILINEYLTKPEFTDWKMVNQIYYYDDSITNHNV